MMHRRLLQLRGSKLVIPPGLSISLGKTLLVKLFGLLMQDWSNVGPNVMHDLMKGHEKEKPLTSHEWMWCGDGMLLVMIVGMGLMTWGFECG